MTDPEQIRAYDDAAPGSEETEAATFALGCFWGPDATFGGMDGVVRTRVGYAGGSASDPTYHDIGDHSEVVQVDYDPDRLSFDDLLDVAVSNHDPRTQAHKRQYQNVLFYETEGERAAIEDRLDALAVGDVQTRVERLSAFTLAEDYHQKYRLRSERAVMAAFEDAGYGDADLRESPAAAKLNAAESDPDLSPASVLR